MGRAILSYLYFETLNSNRLATRVSFKNLRDMAKIVFSLSFLIINVVHLSSQVFRWFIFDLLVFVSIIAGDFVFHELILVEVLGLVELIRASRLIITLTDISLGRATGDSRFASMMLFVIERVRHHVHVHLFIMTKR